ncbi:MAG: hypothetical protein ABIA93_04255 [Candidatus Woesearchaeota archaeon]
MHPKQKIYKQVYPCRYCDSEGRTVYFSNHAIKRAKRRDIAYPEQALRALHNGKRECLGKDGIRIVHKTSKGSIILIGTIRQDKLIIKTIERGN